MIHLVLRFMVGLALILQLGCQMSQSANTRDEKNAQRLANEIKEVAAKPIKLLPVDEGLQDPSFADFRDKLLTATRNHDVEFVLGVLDRNIINGSDTERGIKEFKNQWRIDQREGKLWETLSTILGMGGSFRVSEGNKEFCAPYVTSKWPTVVSQLPQGADPLDYQAIIDKDVAMRVEPDSRAATVTTLSYDVVKVNSLAPRSEIKNSSWLKITTLSGQEGYVPDKYVRSETDYHACFKRFGSMWFMTELAALE